MIVKGMCLKGKNPMLSVSSCRSHKDSEDSVFRRRYYQMSSHVCGSAGGVKGVTAPSKKEVSFSTCPFTCSSIFISPPPIKYRDCRWRIAGWIWLHCNCCIFLGKELSCVLAAVWGFIATSTSLKRHLLRRLITATAWMARVWMPVDM